MALPCAHQVAAKAADGVKCLNSFLREFKCALFVFCSNAECVVRGVFLRVSAKCVVRCVFARVQSVVVRCAFFAPDQDTGAASITHAV